MTTEQAIAYLGRDKLTILEGYITEDIFKKQFLAERLIYSCDWWKAENNGTYFFFCRKNEMNEADYAFINELLTDNGIEVFQVQDLDEGLLFINCRTNEAFDLDELIENYHLNRSEYNPTPDDNLDYHHCVDYFTQNGILIECAVQRQFADDIVSIYFSKLINIDCIYEDNDNIIHIAEIKYKKMEEVDPDTPVLMNKNQAELMKYLIDIHGCRIDLYVLINRMKSEYNIGNRINTSYGMTYMKNHDNERVRNIMFWRKLSLTSEIVNDALNAEHIIQDAHTAVNGRYEVECVSFRYSLFRFISLSDDVITQFSPEFYG